MGYRILVCGVTNGNCICDFHGLLHKVRPVILVLISGQGKIVSEIKCGIFVFNNKHFFSFRCFTIHTPSSNPRLPKNLHFTETLRRPVRAMHQKVKKASNYLHPIDTNAINKPTIKYFNF